MALRTDHDWSIKHLDPFFAGFEEHLIVKGVGSADRGLSVAGG